MSAGSGSANYAIPKAKPNGVSVNAPQEPLVSLLQAGIITVNDARSYLEDDQGYLVLPGPW